MKLYSIHYKGDDQNPREFEGVTDNFKKWLEEHNSNRENGFEGYFLENAEIYYKTALSIPMYSSLNDSDQDRVIETIEKGLS